MTPYLCKLFDELGSLELVRAGSHFEIPSVSSTAGERLLLPDAVACGDHAHWWLSELASHKAWDFTMEMICMQMHGERSALMIPCALTGSRCSATGRRRAPPVNLYGILVWRSFVWDFTMGA